VLVEKNKNCGHEEEGMGQVFRVENNRYRYFGGNIADDHKELERNVPHHITLPQHPSRSLLLS